MNIIYKCKYCDKSCKNYRSLIFHQKFCNLNPERTISKGNPNIKQYAKQRSPYGTWKCKWCNEEVIFETRQKLIEHLKEKHPEKRSPWNKGLTKETCSKIKASSEKLSKTTKGRPGHKMSAEARKKISEARKKYIKEHNGIWWNSRSNYKRSYAEEWTKKIIETEVNDNTFIEEYHFGRWFLDFAWPDKKIYIEIDGDQHEWPERKKTDEEKDSYCIANGWKVLRLKWKDICNNTQIAINVIKEFILSAKIIDYEFKQKERYIKKGYYHLDESIWLERKEKILNSNIDMTKYGWKTALEKTTGLSRRVIVNTIKHFKDEFTEVFIRK